MSETFVPPRRQTRASSSMHDTRVDIEVIKHAVQLACRAPSLHNSQPWRWEVDGARVHLFLDRNRVLHSTDRAAREAVISCGVVLDHFRVAMAAAGWMVNIERFQAPRIPITSHLSISLHRTRSPMRIVSGHRQSCCAEPIDFLSARRRSGRPLKYCCATRSTLMLFGWTCYPTTCVRS
jgi:hypothetical protein